MRTTAHLVRRSAHAAALALLADGVASAPALATSTGVVTLAANDSTGLDGFGQSVAVSGSGTTVAAGSPSSNGGDGRVYVFTESGGTSTQANQVPPPAGALRKPQPARRS